MMKVFVSSVLIISGLLSCRGIKSIPKEYWEKKDKNRNQVIAVFMDGTGDKPFKKKKNWKNTNVKKLHSLASEEIKSLYIEGVGARSRIRHVKKAITTRERIMRAYRFIAENYNSDTDSICLFGFSRGANQCRILSSFIYTIGIIKLDQIKSESRQDMLETLYTIYDTTKISKKKFELASYLNGLGLQHGTHYDTTGKKEIELMGLWDTVEAFVMDDWKEDPTPKCPHLNQLYNVKKLFHAVSLDDNRAFTYTPILATHKNVALNPDQDINTIVEEVWFNGSHKDVGGGVRKKSKDELTTISLKWMLSRLKPYQIFKPSEIPTNIYGEAHDMRDNFIVKKTSSGDTLRGINKYWNVMNPNWNGHRIKVHESVIARLEKGVVQDFKTKKGRLDWYQWEPFSKCFKEEIIDCVPVWKFTGNDCPCITVAYDK